MDLFNALKISGSSLDAQRTVMNVISMNVANAQTTRTEEGGPYRRKIAVLGPASVPSDFPRLLAGRVEQGQEGVEVKQIVADLSDLAAHYDPHHPDADEQGYITLPNVNILEEMVQLMNATRNYEASVTAFNSAKNMILKALEIGR
jgi:flagellar basal-body rod protein FlgC